MFRSPSPPYLLFASSQRSYLAHLCLALGIPPRIFSTHKCYDVLDLAYCMLCGDGSFLISGDVNGSRVPERYFENLRLPSLTLPLFADVVLKSHEGSQMK